MAAGKPYMTFKQFLWRQQALSLYREFLRVLKGVKGAQEREEMKAWIRGEFEQWRHTTDEEAVKSLLAKGRLSLKELQTSIQLSK